MGFEEMMTNAYVENRSALLQLYCMTTLTTCTFCLRQSWWHGFQRIAYTHMTLQPQPCSCAGNQVCFELYVVASVVMLNTAYVEHRFCYQQACHCENERIAINV